MGGVRLTLSLVLALALAFGLPQLVQAFAIPYLARVVASTFWQDWALVAVGALGALVGASLAYIGATFSPGRLRTSILLGAVGAALAMAFTAQWQLTAALAARLPGSERLGALALTVPLLVSVGAAIGVQPLVSRGILAIARYVAARYSLVLVTAAIAGGWLGLTVAQAGLSAVFQQVPVALSLVSACGLIIGVALGLSLATPVGYLVRRFAFG